MVFSAQILLPFRLAGVLLISSSKKNSFMDGESFSNSADFQQIDSEIAILLQPTQNSRSGSSPIRIGWNDTSLSWRHPSRTFLAKDLIGLAQECEERLESDTSMLDTQQLSLWKFPGDNSDPAKISFATLIALNQLESDLRMNISDSSTTPGSAPLLKNMIDSVESSALKAILQAMLLPKRGLNLRNLWWHGFIGDMSHKSWLALTLTLSSLLKPKNKPKKVPALSRPVFSKDATGLTTSAIATGHVVARNNAYLREIETWLPVFHRGMWNLAMSWFHEKKYPHCICAVLTIVLEHSLRIEWCKANDRPYDAQAHVNEYFVTLDGHGQRHQHNILLFPYWTSPEGQEKPNELIMAIGGDCFALLTDLYLSSSGGPNIRAALAHGVLDYQLQEEVSGKASSARDDENKFIWDINQLILAAMHAAASKNTSLRYEPQFSHCAQARARLSIIQGILRQLQNMQDNEKESRVLETYSLSEDIPDELEELHIPGEAFSNLYSAVLQSVTVKDAREPVGQWTLNHVLAEYDVNSRLRSLGATMILLQEVKEALLRYEQELAEALRGLRQDNSLPSRAQRKALRIVSSIRIVEPLYRFAIWVALNSVQHELRKTSTSELCEDKDRLALVQIVKRTRMVISTVDNLLLTNIERSFRPIRDFCRSKSTGCVKVSIPSCRARPRKG